jgi:hypothetical protein
MDLIADRGAAPVDELTRPALSPAGRQAQLRRHDIVDVAPTVENENFRESPSWRTTSSGTVSRPKNRSAVVAHAGRHQDMAGG